MMRVFIFDLDETVIDSRHRTPNNADGTLNLAAYIERHTPENVARDTLLPLADVMRDLIARGEKVWILTARDMKECDYEFLRNHGLNAAKIMSRDRVRSAKHYKSSDGSYKQKWLAPLRNLRQFAKAHFIMFDDAAPVLSALRKFGITCINAHKVNARLA
jgi:beta-phosphoglucomutase-like phosphatase (HAD superfamily)